MTELQQLRQSRRKQTAEDFTCSELVNEMLDKLPSEVWLPEKTFCDPASGNGNFLVEVLRRKLFNNHSPVQALSTIYGVELMDDNVEEMKERLLQVVLDHHPDIDNAQKDELIGILNHNIVCSDAFKWDFENWRSKDYAKPKALF